MRIATSRSSTTEPSLPGFQRAFSLEELRFAPSQFRRAAHCPRAVGRRACRVPRRGSPRAVPERDRRRSRGRRDRRGRTCPLAALVPRVVASRRDPVELELWRRRRGWSRAQPHVGCALELPRPRRSLLRGGELRGSAPRCGRQPDARTDGHPVRHLRPVRRGTAPRGCAPDAGEGPSLPNATRSEIVLTPSAGETTSMEAG